ncbi:MAG: chorismate mutase [Bacteroidota bacterium]
MNPLDEWRMKIDDIDLQLVKLLNERAHCAEEIGKIKLELGLDAYSPQREEEVMRNVTAGNQGPLTGYAVRRLFERIIDESRAVERILMIQRATSAKKK